MQVVISVSNIQISRQIKEILTDLGWKNIKKISNPSHLNNYLKNSRDKIDLLIIHSDFLSGQEENEINLEELREKFLYKLLIFRLAEENNENLILKLVEKIEADDFMVLPGKTGEYRARISLARRKLSERFYWQNNMAGLVEAEDFENIIKREWQRAYRNSTPLSLIMIEVDFVPADSENFRSSNLDVEQQCLKKIAGTISEAGFRPGDIAGFYKNNIFTILLPDTNLKGAREVGKRISRLIVITAKNSDYFTEINSNLGIAGIIPSIRAESSKLMSAAEEALNKAKASQNSNLQTISGSEIESNLRIE